MRIPKYRRRVGKDSAFVEVAGKRHTLPGRYGSAESREAYAAVIRDLAQNVDLPSPAGLRVDELVASYLDHALGYYSHKEYLGFVSACGPLLAEAEDLPVARFSAVLLARVRRRMIALGWARTMCNKQVNRIRRVFRWGVSQDLVPTSVMESLRSLDPLRKGRTKARETAAVGPVDEWAVLATLDHCRPILAAMIRLQWVSGMRSQSLVAVRPGAVDRSGDVWLYRPHRHKGTHLDKDLIVFLGPQAQAILEPFLDRPADAACFSPRESEGERNAARRRPGRDPQVYGAPRNAEYTPDTYRQAVKYAIRRANRARASAAAKAGQQPPAEIPSWFPHQLRHSRGTAVRKRFGLDGAQVYLGHSDADVTQIYAEKDLDLGRRIAREMG